MFEEARPRAVISVVLCAALASCAIPPPDPREPSPGHIGTETPAPTTALDIPAPVAQIPILPPPSAAPPVETYTVVVNEVPVKELLFALARDAAINVDIHPEIEGLVTLNAIDQTLNQILDRISRQIDLRYEMRDDVLVIGPDLPFLKSYKIDYLNIARDSSGQIKSSTEVATAGGEVGGAGGGNTSDTTVSNISNHRFWETLAGNVLGILEEEGGGGGEGIPQSSTVIVNPESGLMTVRASARQHEEIQRYLDLVMTNARRQVLIEATIVEVLLDDRYQAGVDWEKLAGSAGFTVIQSLLGGFTAAASSAATTGLLLNYRDLDAGTPIDVTVQLLQEFGETKVLSSPKLMTLNNQTAVLRVVDNLVYFTIELEEDERDSGTITTNFTSQVNTVAVGLIMNVTPQISEADTVTLNIRPTITRAIDFVSDPAVALTAARLGLDPGAVPPSVVPVVRVREAESVLKVGTGQIAVLGGLMQDTTARNTDQIPVLGDVDVLGEAFKYNDRNYLKSELVVFLRPWVIRTPDIGADLRLLEPMLPENLRQAQPMKTVPRLSY